MADITVDTELSLTSENPVQNKVVTQKFYEVENDIEKATLSLVQLNKMINDEIKKIKESGLVS
jgi:hypothetical protein|nr:MAG TPA: hypothetical protein [Caudoviricetes sp.]